MPTVTVIAIRQFDHEGRTYRRGDRVTATPAEAAALARHRFVSLDRSLYNRRDMVATPVPAMVFGEPEPAPEIDTEPPAPRRRGRPRKTPNAL